MKMENLNNMKKMSCVILVLMLVFSATSFAFAEDEVSEEPFELDNETQEEVKIMNNSVGAKIRLLQLEKSIAKNIVKGEYVLSYLNESDLNSTLLEAILTELELLKDEVSNADPNSSEAVQIFVDLKSDAINTTKDFRDTLHSLLGNETLGLLKNQTKNLGNNSFKNLGQRIRNCIREYNGNQIKKISKHMIGINDSIINAYKHGNYTINQIKHNISKKLENMNKSRIHQIILEMKQSKIQKNTRAQNQIANVTNGFLQRKQDRIQQRLNNTQGFANGLVKQQMQNHMSQKIEELKGKGNSDNPGNSGNKGNKGGQGGQ